MTTATLPAPLMTVPALLNEIDVEAIEYKGHIIAAGPEEVELMKLQETAKLLPGIWWVELASEWFMEEGLSGYVIGFAGRVQHRVETAAECLVILAQQGEPEAAEAEGEVILEALEGVEPKLPKRDNTKIALFLCALSNGATEAELQEIIGKNKATVRQFIYYVCRTSCKAFGCRLVGDRYHLIQAA